jgi:hypothetical protein
MFQPSRPSDTQSDPNATSARHRQPMEFDKFMGLKAGDKVRLKNEAIAEVTANPGDGGWLMVRFIENPKEPSKVGEEDFVYYIDVIEAVV